MERRMRLKLKSAEGLATPLLITLVLLVLMIAGGGVYFLTQRQSLEKEKTGETKTGAPTGVATPTPMVNFFESDDFKIVVPEGWSTAGQMPGSLVTMMKISEDHSQDPKAQKINFKSYIAVSFDKTQGKTREELLELVKQSLTQMSPETEVKVVEALVIDGQPADFVELSLNQQEVDFKVLVGLIVKGEKYFVISANTTALKYPEYQELFYQTAESFKFKY